MGEAESGEEDVEAANGVEEDTESRPLGCLGASRGSSRCSSWSQPHLFAQLLPEWFQVLPT